jgi:hypothetical protein
MRIVALLGRFRSEKWSGIKDFEAVRQQKNDAAASKQRLVNQMIKSHLPVIKRRNDDQRSFIMNKFAATAALVSALAAAPAAFAIQPSAVPDTGTLSKAPVGSTVQINGTDNFGDRYVNFFRVTDDGSLQLVDQVRQSND